MIKRYFICLFITLLCFNLYSQIELDKGLVGNFNFTKKSLEDNSAYDDLTISGDVYTFIDDRNGNAESAIDLNGAHLQGTTNTRDISNILTYSFWIKTKQINTGRATLTHKYDWQVSEYGFQVILKDGKIYTGGRNGSGEYQKSDPSETIVSNGEWHHIVASRDENSRTMIWIDGKLEVDNDFDYAIDNIPNEILLEFGKQTLYQTTLESSDYIGAYDDIRIYNRILSECEINALYSVNIPETETITVYETITVEKTVEVEKEVIVYDTVEVEKEVIVYDTVEVKKIVTVYDTVAVTDTLYIYFETTDIGSALETNLFKVFPNPTNDFITISTGDYEQLTAYMVKIVDLQGKVIYETDVDSQEKTVNLSEFGSKGQFIISIINKNGIIIQSSKIILK